MMPSGSIWPSLTSSMYALISHGLSMSMILRAFREQAAQVERPVHVEEGVQEGEAVDPLLEYPMAHAVVALLEPQDQMPVILEKPVEAAFDSAPC